MSYDAATVAMLRAVFDELLVSEAFTSQNQCSAVDMAQYILHLASKGERDAQKIKRHVQNLLSARVAA
jgi:hypothetical protein